MILLVLVGTLALVAAGFGIFLSRKVVVRSRAGRAPLGSHPSLTNPRQQKLAELFMARLKSGAIGIADLVRLLRNEGHDPKDIRIALEGAMARFPHLAGRRDKLEAWIKEGERSV